MPRRTRPIALLLATALSFTAAELAPAPAQAAYTITEYPTLTAGALPESATLGRDGNVWFTEFNANQIGKITPAGVGMAQVTWASAAPAAGFGFGVQVKPPGSSSYLDWLGGVTSQTAVFGPDSPLWAGPGTYRFRAGMVNTVNGATSGYSPAKAITLS